MKITIESTDEITHFDSVECRHWRGATDGGVPCHVFVHRMAVRKDENCELFKRELKEKLQSGRLVDLRHIL